jgi:iron(III) transport system substrate-binding protein
MLNHLRRGISAALVSVVLAGCGGSAGSAPAKPAASGPATLTKDSSAADVFAYSGANRKQLLEDGAKREGKVVVYTIWPVDLRAKPVVDAFHKQYPDIDVQIVNGQSNDINSRVLAEYQATKYTGDLVESGFDTISLLTSKGYLAKYASPVLDGIPANVKDPGGLFVADRQTPLVFAFNTTKIPASDAPTTWDNLLDPKWKGKVTTEDASQAIRYFGGLLRVKGEDYLRKLATQNLTIYGIPQSGVRGFLLSGEVPASFPNSLGNVLVDVKKNAPLAWSAMEKTPMEVGWLGMLSHAPHPFATALFVDWLLSDDGQNAMVTTGEGAVRQGIASPFSEFKIDSFYTEIEVGPSQFLTEYDKWQTLFNQLMGTARKS